MNGVIRWIVVFTAWGVIGCGGDKWTRNLPATVPAKGVVTLDGQPVEGAAVVFAPADGGQHTATALTRSDGSFSLNAFPSKSGAVPGEYTIGVSKTVEAGLTVPKNFNPGEDAAHAEAPTNASTSGWINALPAQYASPATSGLKATIPPQGTSDLKIELKSGAAASGN